jgi:anti-sigma factor RsiW
MKCSQIRRKISAFLDAELDGAISRHIEEHIDTCPGCREYLHEFREVDDLVHGLPKIDLSLDFTSRVVSEAVKTSSIVSRKTVTFRSRLRILLARLSETVFNLFEPGADPSTRTLDELGDCPPLSMGYIYFKILDQSNGG